MSASRLEIAEELLGSKLSEGQFAPCPGRQFHSKGNGKRDFRVVLDGAPTGFCFHDKCSDEVARFNKELRQRIWRAERGEMPAPRSWGEGVSAEPTAERAARPKLDRPKVEEFVRGVPAIDAGWLWKRSPAGWGLDAGAFLDVLYPKGERVLVFTSQHSQGDFLWLSGGASAVAGNSPARRDTRPTPGRGFRLSAERGVKATASALPSGGKDGVWFLVQPVTGLWAINAKVSQDGQPARWTRRSECNVTAWRYFVLESDELAPELWLRVLAALPVPIAAIYTSGGRSIHALVKMEVESKATWDLVRNQLRQIVCPLGADPAALSAVRLSRLPGCRRGDRLQELLYLDPEPSGDPLRLRREVR